MRPSSYPISNLMQNCLRNEVLKNDFNGSQDVVTEPEYVVGHEDVSTHLPWFMRGGEHRPWQHEPDAKLFPEDAPGDDR